MGTLGARMFQWRPLQVAPRAHALLAIPWIRHLIMTGRNSLYAEMLTKHYKCFENYFIQF